MKRYKIGLLIILLCGSFLIGYIVSSNVNQINRKHDIDTNSTHISTSESSPKGTIPFPKEEASNLSAKDHINDIVKKGPYKGELARPYIDSNGTTLLIDEIMRAGTPVKDTVLKNGLRWDVQGTFRGSTGTWELVVDTSTNTIVHFNFVAK